MTSEGEEECSYYIQCDRPSQNKPVYTEASDMVLSTFLDMYLVESQWWDDRRQTHSWYLNWSKKQTPTIDISEELMHRRMQHVGKTYVREAAKTSKKIHLRHRLTSDKRYMDTCECCQSGKQKAKRVSKRPKARELVPGALVSADIKDFTQPDIEGNTKCLVLVDSATRLTLVGNLKTKSATDIATALEKLFINFQYMTGHEVEILQPDSERVLVDSEGVQKTLLEHKVHLRPSPPYKHSRNGLVERTIGLLGDRMRCMEKDLGVPAGLFAGRCIQAAAYVKNLTPSSALNNKSPYEVITGEPAPYHHLRVWGSRVSVKIHTQKKLHDDRTREGILVGYGNHNTLNTYTIFMPDTGRFIHSEDCVINENKTIDLNHLTEDDKDDETYRPPENADLSVETAKILPKRMRRGKKKEKLDKDDRVMVKAGLIDKSLLGSSKIIFGTVIHRFTGGKVRIRLDGVNDTYDINEENLRVVADVQTHIASVLLCERLTYHKAMRSKYKRHFVEAMKREWDNLVHKFKVISDYIDESKVPPEAQKIHMMWSMEFKPEREAEKMYRARCLAQGNEEKLQDIQKLFTYAPTATKESLRILISMSVHRDWVRLGLDVSNAFLNTKMDQIEEAVETYFYPPPGPCYRRGKMVKKLKNIYGLSTAPRYWFMDLKSTLEDLGFRASPTDECLFIKYNAQGKSTMALVVHVDDMMVVGPRSKVLAFKTTLQTKYEIRDLGFDPEKYLGIEFDYPLGKGGGVRMHQTNYIDVLYEKFMSKETSFARKVKTPLVNLLDQLGDGEVNADVPYRSLIGGLLYIAVSTRPDIAFPIMHLSRFLCKHSMVHYRAALRVLEYLNNTKHYGLWYRPLPEVECKVRVYADADLGNPCHKSRSTTGYVITVGGHIVNWGSKLQTTVAQSTLVAEYGALDYATKEGLFIQHLLEDLNNIHHLSKGSGEKLVEVFCDNEKLVQSLKSGSLVGSKAVRHLRLKIRWLQQELNNNKVLFDHISGKDNPADLFTKALSAPEIQKYLRTLDAMFASKE